MKRIAKKAEKELELEFNDKELLLSALAHSSFVFEKNSDEIQSYEKLEFLGDAVLELIVTDYIYRKFPEMNEGELTNLRARLVNANSMARVARSINLGSFLLLGKGEEETKGREKKSLLANSLEALIGAIYLDKGIEEAQKFVYKNFMKKIQEESRKKVTKDFKSKLQEVSAKLLGLTPKYSIIKEEGPDHRKIFLARVEAGKNIVGKGKGASKKEAEQIAAREALQILEGKK